MSRRPQILAAALAVAVWWAAPALAAEDPARLPVRFGVHPTFERMVFDWPQPVEYRVDTKDGITTVSFGRNARLDAASLIAGLTRVAGGVAVREEGGQLKLAMTLTDGTRLRHFRNGNKVVVDFSKATDQQQAAPPPAPKPAQKVAVPPVPAPPKVEKPAAAAPKPAAPVAPPAAAAPAVAPPPAAAAPAAAPQPAATPQQTLKPRPLRRTPAGAPAAAAPKPAPSAASLVPKTTSKAAPAAPQPHVAAAPAPARAAPATPPQAVAAPATPAANATPAPVAKSAPAAAPKPAGPVQVNLVRTPDGYGLRFGWQEPVGAAVFARGAYVWVVFDRPGPLDIGALKAKPEDVLGEVEAFPASAGTALRLAPANGTSVAARREGTSWIVDLGRIPRNTEEVNNITLRNAEDPAKARLLVDLAGAQNVLRLRDPEVGDELIVIPSAASGAAVPNGRQYPQLRVLPTAQGAAFQSLTDQLNVRALGNAVEIAAGQGLIASVPPEPLSPHVRAPRMPRPAQLFDFAAWRMNGPLRFTEDRQSLHRAVSSATDENRTNTRMDLARFLFAYGLAVDALGVLRLIDQDDPGVTPTPALYAIRGVSALMLGDLDESARSLRHPSLDGFLEAAIWRGALTLAEDDAKAALPLMARAPNFTDTYPPAYSHRINLDIARARLDMQDLDGAAQALDEVAANRPSPGEQGQIDHLRGRILLARGESDAAVALWTEVDRGPNSAARVAATLDRVDVLLKENKMPPAEAAAALERLRFAWRGDQLEFRVLDKLGRVQMEAAEYRNGFLTMRDAVTRFPNQPETKALVDEMSQTFSRLFLKGEADKLPPVTAIGLFEEFRELSPPGAEGDEMVRKLADRMIAVDLLERAASLLDNQLRFRLNGVPKAETGTRLALVQLLDKKPQAALDTLRDSDVPDMPAELARDRRRLAARANADLGQTQLALARLDGDIDQEADLLRADILWRAQDWAGAALVLDRLAGNPPDGKAPMGDNQARQVLHLGVALALAADEPGLKRLRDRFGPAMERGSYKDVFRVVAANKGGPITDVRDIASQVAAVGPYQSFLAGYRQRVSGSAPAPAKPGG